MKKALVIALCLIMAVSVMFVGCGNTTNTEETTKKKKARIKNIKIKKKRQEKV